MPRDQDTKSHLAPWPGIPGLWGHQGSNSRAALRLRGHHCDAARCRGPLQSRRRAPLPWPHGSPSSVAQGDRCFARAVRRNPHEVPGRRPAEEQQHRPRLCPLRCPESCHSLCSCVHTARSPLLCLLPGWHLLLAHSTAPVWTSACPHEQHFACAPTCASQALLTGRSQPASSHAPRVSAEMAKVTSVGAGATRVLGTDRCRQGCFQAGPGSTAQTAAERLQGGSTSGCNFRGWGQRQHLVSEAQRGVWAEPTAAGPLFSWCYINKSKTLQGVASLITPATPYDLCTVKDKLPCSVWPASQKSGHIRAAAQCCGTGETGSPLGASPSQQQLLSQPLILW